LVWFSHIYHGKKDYYNSVFVVVALRTRLTSGSAIAKKKKAAAGKGPAKVEGKGGLSGSPE